MYLFKLDLNYFSAQNNGSIEIPVTFIPEAKKNPEKQKTVKKKIIPDETAENKGLLTSNCKNVLLEKYLFYLREEIEKNKYTPPGSRYYGLVGNVGIACTITGSGTFKNIRITRFSGDDLLDKTALNSIHKTNGTYKRPAWTGKKPIHVLFTIKYQYGL